MNEKRGSKGQEIAHTYLTMSDYLMPNNSEITGTEQSYIFSVRNRMINLPDNFLLKHNTVNLACAC